MILTPGSPLPALLLALHGVPETDSPSLDAEVTLLLFQQALLQYHAGQRITPRPLPRHYPALMRVRLRVMQELDEKTGGSAEAAFAAQLPGGRLGEGDDIARVVLFAASDLGKYLTGSTLLVDGGEVYAAGATAASE